MVRTDVSDVLHHVSMRLRSAALPLALILGLVLGAMACTSNDGVGPACGGAPTPGAVSFWSDCDPSARVGEPLSFSLSNHSAETVWFHHHCTQQVPWLARLDAEGTWQAALPPDCSLAVECEHVEHLEPGETLAFTLSTL